MKKLWVQNSDIFNADGGKISSSIIYSENAPNENYEDKSNDIAEWYNSSVLDWSRRRDMIAPLFYAIAGYDLATYSNLSASQKLIGAKCFLVPYSLRVTNGTVTDQEDFDNGVVLLKESKQSRIECVESMRRYVWNEYVRKGNLTLAQSQQFYIDVKDYLNDFNEANISDFKNWIFGLTPFETDFSSKDYYSVGLQDGLMDIYNGNY